MSAWLWGHQTLLWWLGGLSVVLFVGTLAALPIIVIRIPADYFMRDQRHTSHRHLPASLLLRRVVKNLFGLVCILAGVAMLVLPGQGILTIMIGLMLMDFPGKRALELRLVQQPAVLRAINTIRAKAHKPALEVPMPSSTRAEGGEG